MYDSLSYVSFPSKEGIVSGFNLINTFLLCFCVPSDTAEHCEGMS